MPITLSSANICKIVCGPIEVATVPLTTAAITVDAPSSGLDSGPTNVNSVPV